MKVFIPSPLCVLQARDKQLMTPLFVAATFGNLEICRRLIQAQASLFTKDETEQNALHRACMEGHLVGVFVIILYCILNESKLLYLYFTSD